MVREAESLFSIDPVTLTVPLRSAVMVNSPSLYWAVMPSLGVAVILAPSGASPPGRRTPRSPPA